MTILPLQNGWNAFSDALDANMRRAANFLATVLPLMFLLVGSCKTAELPGAYGDNSDPAQFRVALFPDSLAQTSATYRPAAGYVSRARTFVKGYPDAVLMLTENEVNHMFGAPAFVRQDADAKIWQYVDNECVLEFYFYDTDAADGLPPVAYYDVRFRQSGSLGIADGQKARCVGRVLERGFSLRRV